MLREYQQRAIDHLYQWFAAGNEGEPCLVLPTGSGKSHIIAALIRDALTQWPETRVLMLTHQKELIAQNAEKLRQHWPGAPLGIYSAALRRRCLDEPITFAGIQSVAKRGAEIGHVDIAIVDECFVSGTKILTPTGEKDIDIVRCGDYVYNALGVGTVTCVTAKPCDELYKLEFSDGTKCECTGNHPFFTEQGWLQARELEVGAYFFSVEGLRMLWEIVQPLDENQPRDRKDDFSMSRRHMEQAIKLLRVLCKEVEEPNEQPSIKNENEGEAKGDKTQAYKAWRQRATSAFASIGSASCFRGWMGSGAINSNKDETSWNRLSNLLQSGLGKSINDASHRDRRIKPFIIGEKSARFEENGFFNFPRLERISRFKSESARTVFNLRVSGHPSFFANGKLAHNCHAINHAETGSYRRLIADLVSINPALRIIGLTATPYRLGHGMIHEGKDVLFSDLIEPVSIMELVQQGYLAPLRSKHTQYQLDASGVRKQGGEYVAAALEQAMDTAANNASAIDETIARAADRKSWLLFCAGVSHAQHVCDQLIARGISAACVTGATTSGDRDAILRDFKAGSIRAVTNVNVLTTGFDYPGIDCLVMLRPTLSPGLYVQMAGRGMRIAPGKTDCLVLDFAGNVATHGPITAVIPPRKATKGDGEPVTRTCPECSEQCAASSRVCPACGYQFPVLEKPPPVLANDDIMGLQPSEMAVESWQWRPHTSRASGKEMIRVSYYGGLSDPRIDEYLPILHEGYAGQKAMRLLGEIKSRSGASGEGQGGLTGICEVMNTGRPPASIGFFREGKFFRVTSRTW